MRLVELIIIAPLWGLMSTHFFVQAWFGVVLLLVYAVGFARGAVPRRDTSLGMLGHLITVVMYSLLLLAGDWFVGWLGVPRTAATRTVYWVFCGLAVLFLLPQIPPKLRQAWRHATVPGAREDELILGRLRGDA